MVLLSVILQCHPMPTYLSSLTESHAAFGLLRLPKSSLKSPSSFHKYYLQKQYSENSKGFWSGPKCCVGLCMPLNVSRDGTGGSVMGTVVLPLQGSWCLGL